MFILPVVLHIFWFWFSGWTDVPTLRVYLMLLVLLDVLRTLLIACFGSQDFESLTMHVLIV